VKLENVSFEALVSLIEKSYIEISRIHTVQNAAPVTAYKASASVIFKKKG